MTAGSETPGAARDWGVYYDVTLPLWRELRDEAKFILERRIRAAGLKIHSLSDRVKDRTSFMEKIERKGYVAPETQLTDYVGLRAISLFVDDLPKLDTIVRGSFTILEDEDKVEGGGVEEFGYMSHHYLCRLPPELAGERYDRIKHLVFEVQTRTMVQDAWANVSHYLAYKGETSIPEELRKDFHALAGLFYVADKHFQFFFRESERVEVEAAADVRESVVTDLPIDRAHVTALLKDLFPERTHSAAKDVSGLVEELTEAGYTTLSQLEHDLKSDPGAAIRRDQETIREWEMISPRPIAETDAMKRYRQTGVFFTDVGAARAILQHVNEPFAVVAGEKARATTKQIRVRIQNPD